MRVAAGRLLIQAVLGWMLQLSSAWAGGGPETTLVVVNSASPLSVTIGNAYVQMRDIPDSHVVWLSNVPASDSLDIQSFRTRIWKPIREYMAAHHLEDEIDTIAYSADFPFRVDFQSDLKANKIPGNRYRGNYASLTGLTFFGRRVEREDMGYLGGNFYFRRDLARRNVPPRQLSAQEARLIEDAIKALDHNDYNHAVEPLQTVVKDYPWSADAWYHLARGLAASGRSDDAMEALSKAADAGWSHSLSARDDKLLKPLRSYPGFPDVIHRMQLNIGPFQAAHGFRNRYIWTGRDTPLVLPTDTDSLDRYYLSTLLAYTGLRGNSMPEVLNYLRAAVSSDGSFPDGTVYLMENSDIRSKTREGSFHATVAALTERGHRAEILASGQDMQNGIIPQNKKDVIGAVVGAQRFNWARSNSQLLPGAIAESLTSYGGDFNRDYQTKLTEFLRYGAAGSSGAVAEPYSFQAKFPVPSLHIHYADGSSLAEAFYQSIRAPYQLIVVGEPLARPFAHFAEVSLESPNTAQAWHGAVLLKPATKPAPDRAIQHLELWVDGQHTDQVAPWDAFLWDTTAVEDGCHDIRLIAVDDSPIETRSYLRIPATVNNRNHGVDVNTVGKPVALGDVISLSGAAPQAQRVEVFQGTRLLGTAQLEDGRWTAAVPSQALGLGRVSLYARAFYRDGSTARSCGTFVNIEPPPRLPADNKADPDYEEGLQVSMRDNAGNNRKLVIKKLDGRFRELRKVEKTVASLQFNGEFDVASSGYYQLALVTQGRLRVTIDGELKMDVEISGDDQGIYIPLNLGSGWHSLDIGLVPKGQPFLEARLAGDEVAVMLAEQNLRH